MTAYGTRANSARRLLNNRVLRLRALVRKGPGGRATARGAHDLAPSVYPSFFTGRFTRHTTV